MSSIATSSIIFALVFGSSLFGMFLHGVLPEYLLGAGSEEVVRLGMSLVSTTAALALGLLIASAKSSYDGQNTAMVDASAKAVLLDRLLAHYGLETKEIRDLLRDFVTRIMDQTWPKNGAHPSSLEAPSTEMEILFDKIQGLSPKDENQRSLKAQALRLGWDIVQTR